MSGYDTPVAATSERVPVADEAKRAELYAMLERHADFPKPGIMFVDVWPLFRHPGAIKYIIDGMAAAARGFGCDVVVGIEARGLTIGPLLASALSVSFVPLRKAGKLPGHVRSHTYTLEYGTATLEAAEGCIAPSSRAIVVDDVLATGGTLAAGVELTRALGADVRCAMVLVEIVSLAGVRSLPVPVLTVMSV